MVCDKLQWRHTAHGVSEMDRSLEIFSSSKPLMNRDLVSDLRFYNEFQLTGLWIVTDPSINWMFHLLIPQQEAAPTLEEGSNWIWWNFSFNFHSGFIPQKFNIWELSLREQIFEGMWRTLYNNNWSWTLAKAQVLLHYITVKRPDICRELITKFRFEMDRVESEQQTQLWQPLITF